MKLVKSSIVYPILLISVFQPASSAQTTYDYFTSSDTIQHVSFNNKLMRKKIFSETSETGGSSQINQFIFWAPLTTIQKTSPGLLLQEMIDAR